MLDLCDEVLLTSNKEMEKLKDPEHFLKEEFSFSICERAAEQIVKDSDCLLANAKGKSFKTSNCLTKISNMSHRTSLSLLLSS